ncbi:SDR family NAD(P)-dependent oxidoreductase [Zhongshania sp.]|uniref:SDR family NAD(P)-dependent oxidoreductase n=1 Tax=Zhongshania sp. TaxID=1971902 RepID=UPI001B5460E5|nr:SDR family NAD(P)-dependent oxidoreductase [Zhongshania sp.]MBQ0797498.1 SDR family NAD(P)-dependent oxidoreductase [Zhongshania sp.]
MKYTLNEAIVVDRPIEDCFAYLKDFSTIEQWDPGVYRSRKLTPGSPKVGTEYEILLKLPANKQAAMHYRQIAIEQPRQLILEGVGDNFSALDTITFTALDKNRTSIDYRAELDLAWLQPSTLWIFKPLLKRIGTKAVNGLQVALSNPDAPASRRLKNDICDKLVVPAALGFGKRGYLSQPRKSHSNRMDGKVVAITGPTAGLGLDAACELSRLGATLILIGRDEEKLQHAATDIQNFSGCVTNSLHIVEADLSSLHATSAAAKAILQTQPRIDVLINNAGALFATREETAEGFEQALAVNFLAPVLLSKLLDGHFTDASRVINVVSGGLYFQGVNLDDLQFRNEAYDGSKAYARAKRALLYMSQENTGKTSYYTMHPGWAATPGVAKSLPAFNNKLKHFMRDGRMGADTMIWLATAPELSRSDRAELWFDRQPHTCDVLPGTKSSAAEIQQLRNWTLATLSRFE